MSYVHPYFGTIPDRYVAEACSEVLIPGEYKNNYSLEGTNFTPADGFPPEPAYLSSLTAAIIDRDGSSVRRIALHDISGNQSKPKDRDLVDSYRDSVVFFQNIATEFEIIAEHFGIQDRHPQFGRLGQWAINLTKASGKRVIAAHLAFITVDGKRVHDGMSYPTEIKEDFPLLLRSFLRPLTNGEEQDFTQIGIDSAQSAVLNDNLSKVMKNDKSIQAVAALPPSTVMPALPNFRMGLKQSRSQTR